MSSTSCLSPKEFHFGDINYIFDKTEIYHCVCDNSRYVVAEFTYNGVNGLWMKFHNRRLQDGTWGGFISKRFEPFGYLQKGFLGRHSYDEQFKPGTYSVLDQSAYLDALEKKNEQRRKSGLRTFEPMDYNLELVEAHWIIIQQTIQPCRRFIGQKPNGFDLEEVQNEYSRQVLSSNVLAELISSSSSSASLFEVMCLDANGYNGRFVNGGSYQAFDGSDDMIFVLAEDGSQHLMFEDRFVRV